VESVVCGYHLATACVFRQRFCVKHTRLKILWAVKARAGSIPAPATVFPWISSVFSGLLPACESRWLRHLASACVTLRPFRGYKLATQNFGLGFDRIVLGVG
jgi:hypothetical protein